MNWISPEFQKELDKVTANFSKWMWYVSSDPDAMRLHELRRKRSRDNRKFAYIQVGHTRKLAWVDNVTLQAYKMGAHYEKTYMQHPRFTFIRWCTGMDI